MPEPGDDPDVEVAPAVPEGAPLVDPPLAASPLAVEGCPDDPS
jgi:hypothetical protein